ncbi:MAG: ribose-phosphate pyrophosphokinase [Deltaproteobacteria bacterium]|nr:ribose-phosphate pyrophosphokinase [Deltaproteobacteria bacterium]
MPRRYRLFVRLSVALALLLAAAVGLERPSAAAGPGALARRFFAGLAKGRVKGSREPGLVLAASPSQPVVTSLFAVARKVARGGALHPVGIEPFSNDELSLRVPAAVQGRSIVVAQPAEAREPSTALFRTLLAVAASQSNLASSVHVVLDRGLAKRFDPAFVATLFSALHADSLRYADAHGGPLERLLRPLRGSALAQRLGVDGPLVPRPVHLPREGRRSKRSGSAAPPLLWSGHGYPELARGVGEAMGLAPRFLPTEKAFQGRQILPEDPAGRRVYLLQTKRLGDPEALHRDLFEVLYAAWQAKQRGAAEVTLVMPYLPYSRSDRMDTAGTTVGAAVLPQLARAVGVDRVAFYSVHQPQEVGFFLGQKIQVLHASGEAVLAPAVARHLKAKLTPKELAKHVRVLAPDPGARKRALVFARLLAAELGLPEVKVVVAEKERHGRDVKTRFTANVRKAVLVAIDDETASGKTLAQLVEPALAKGATSMLAAVSHLTGPAYRLLDSSRLERLFALDTVPQPREHHDNAKIEIVSVAQAVGRLLTTLDGRGDLSKQLFWEHE